jgi:ferredoxin
MTDTVYSVSGDCLRCGACSTLAPGLIRMDEAIAAMVRQPATREEVAVMEAALFNCPLLAIRRRTAPGQEARR